MSKGRYTWMSYIALLRMVGLPTFNSRRDCSTCPKQARLSSNTQRSSPVACLMRALHHPLCAPVRQALRPGQRRRGEAERLRARVRVVADHIEVARARGKRAILAQPQQHLQF